MKARNLLYTMGTTLYLIGCATTPNHAANQPIMQHGQAGHPSSGQSASPSNSLESKINEARNLIMELKPTIGGIVIINENVSTYKKAVQITYQGLLIDIGITYDGELKLVSASEGKLRGWIVKKGDSKPSYHEINGNPVENIRSGDQRFEWSLGDVLEELRKLR